MKTIGIYLYQNMDVLDFAGPYEVFNTCQRLWAQHTANPLDLAFKVVTIAETSGEKIARGGLKVIAENGIDYHPHVDILIVPGGVVAAELNKPGVVSWIRMTSERADITVSVCTGSFLLAHAGLLNGRKATAHQEDTAILRASYPEIEVIEDIRWVNEGHIITSGGVADGIDICLYLVGRIIGREHAVKTARQMAYQWKELE